MRSSTSSSERAAADARRAQPLAERQVPRVALGTAACIALAVFAIALGAWEWRMRSLGLQAGDLGPTRGAWAMERRRVDAGDVRVAIVGSSRVLFGTDLAEFERVTGVQPVQLALQGSSTRLFMADLAADPDFRGLLIVDVTPLNYFRPGGGGLFDDALDYFRDESLTQKSDHWLDQRLQRGFAYMDSDYRLMKLLERDVPIPERPGVRGASAGVWKVATTHERRQTHLWERVRHDERLRSHAAAIWRAAMARVPAPTPAEIETIIQATRRDVEAIRARGGDVVFVRPPSSGELARIEAAKFPLEQVWTRLLAETGVAGFHYSEHAQTRGLTCVEESHLAQEDAVTFTRAYSEFVRGVLAR